LAERTDFHEAAQAARKKTNKWEPDREYTMVTLIIDCFAGISASKLLAALVDAGAGTGFIAHNLQSLGLKGCRIDFKECYCQGIKGMAVDFDAGEYEHAQVNFAELNNLIINSNFPGEVKSAVAGIYLRLKEAERRAYGLPPGELDFREGGSVKSLFCTAGVALAIHNLQVRKIYCSPLPTGWGMTGGRDGLLPVPTPATAELLVNIPVHNPGVAGELTTLTGAAIAVTLAGSFGAAPEMLIKKTGYGIGTGRADIPDMVRVFLGDCADAGGYAVSGPVKLLETNIDDMNPQYYEHIMSLLLQAGVLDVFITPVYMKKNRPGNILTVLCRDDHVQAAADIVFKETTTLGLRIREEQRIVLQRSFSTVETSYGKVRVKVAYGADGTSPVHWSPEYEDCKLLAERAGVSLQKIYMDAMKKYAENPAPGKP
jgi:uncharacterized protein (TIGR00299 family) protein